MEGEIINRVSNSKLVTFDLEELYTEGERVQLDLKDRLFEGLILREKILRDYIKEHDWKQYKSKFVAITCTADAVIPTWAYMLLTSALQPYAAKIIFGTLEDLEIQLFNDKLSKIDWRGYENSKVVIKGCSKVNVPISAYLEVTNKLLPFASSIMYGEPCSTVPIFKRKL
jgi:hypothetical protein